jgi:DNA-directed RNA polymerase specialized sigma24 family protein
MPDPKSVSWWIQQIGGASDDEAAQALWQRYFTRLVGLARQRLRGVPRRAVDEEDVALSAFDSFCRGAAQGRFPRLSDRQDLWQLLVVLTVRKSADLARHEGRRKRGGGDVLSASALEGDDRDAAAFAELVSREPDPAFAAEVAETCRALLDALGDPTLQTVALARMEGQTNEEIARRIGKAVVTVERKLKGIRDIWDKRAEQ